MSQNWFHVKFVGNRSVSYPEPADAAKLAGPGSSCPRAASRRSLPLYTAGRSDRAGTSTGAQVWPAVSVMLRSARITASSTPLLPRRPTALPCLGPRHFPVKCLWPRLPCVCHRPRRGAHSPYVLQRNRRRVIVCRVCVTCRDAPCAARCALHIARVSRAATLTACTRGPRKPGAPRRRGRVGARARAPPPRAVGARQRHGRRRFRARRRGHDDATDTPTVAVPVRLRGRVRGRLPADRRGQGCERTRRARAREPTRARTHTPPSSRGDAAAAARHAAPNLVAGSDVTYERPRAVAAGDAGALPSGAAARAFSGCRSVDARARLYRAAGPPAGRAMSSSATTRRVALADDGRGRGLCHARRPPGPRRRAVPLSSLSSPTCRAESGSVGVLLRVGAFGPVAAATVIRPTWRLRAALLAP